MSTKERHAEPTLSYFEIQAYVGTTKHMGGLEMTKRLVERCNVIPETQVLDVGCGVGATACYLAQTYGCRVTGVDLRESMVEQAIERAQREGVDDQVAFAVADVRSLPFADARFDVVLCESVVTFVAEKQRAIDAYARVTRSGGCVGLNEEVWLRAPPDEMLDYARQMWGIDEEIPTADVWQGWMEKAGLHDVTGKTHAVEARRESTQILRYRLSDIARMFWRMLVLYVRSPAFRAYMRKQRRVPRRIFNYLGYGVFTGRK